MKTTHTFAFAIATCLAALTYGQQTTTTYNKLSPTGRINSVQDSPGILGHQFADLSFAWTDFRHSDAEGYDAAFTGNVPLAAGFDAGLGYSYYWEGKHRDPFTRASSNARNHNLLGYGKFYLPLAGGAKPFLGGGVGYQWVRGDLQRLRTYGHEWLWSAVGGVELPFAGFALIPQVSFNDTWRGGSSGTWSYGAQVHHWFNEKMGGYLDATYHNPQHSSGGELWTYMGGLRFRF